MRQHFRNEAGMVTHDLENCSPFVCKRISEDNMKRSENVGMKIESQRICFVPNDHVLLREFQDEVRTSPENSYHEI